LNISRWDFSLTNLTFVIHSFIMKIRKATPEDSKSIAYLLMLAMEDIAYAFITEKSYDKATQFLSAMASEKGNQYSYENCWVAENEEEIIAVASLYDGGKLHELRKPVANYIKEHFNRDFNPEDETQAGEIYIDCVGVNPNQQGKGIGSKIFAFLIEEYVIKQKQTLGLLVDYDNPKAEKLYLKLGFKIVGEKTLVGKRLKHLQYHP
jgi:N-acetylglutamate synthase-like GNAT family acetyltransferase